MLNEIYYNFTNELYCNKLSQKWGCQAPLGTYERYANACNSYMFYIA